MCTYFVIARSSPPVSKGWGCGIATPSARNDREGRRLEINGKNL